MPAAALPALGRLAISGGIRHPFHRELIGGVVAAAVEAGFDAELLTDSARLPEFDSLLVVGPPSFDARFREQALLSGRPSRRICWYGENLPRSPATFGESVARRLPSARILDVARATLGRLGGARTDQRILALRERAAVQRELAYNLAELRAARTWIHELVVSSPNRVAGAALAGWQARRVPFGYHPDFAGPIVPPADGPRDIDVVFLGRDIQTGTRRARELGRFRRALGERAALAVIDRDLYGAERHALLRRARVVVDVHRVPYNATGLRFVIATAAGAALVNEATHDAWLASPDDHVVELPVEDLADAVATLLRDEPRRQRLVEASQSLLADDLALKSLVARVLGPIT